MWLKAQVVEQRRSASPRLTLIIDVAQRLTIGVTHDETVWRDFGSPRRREAAGGHIIVVAARIRGAYRLQVAPDLGSTPVDTDIRY